MSDAPLHSRAAPRARPWVPLLAAAVGLGFLWFLYRNTTLLFVSLVLSIALHYALGPLVDWLENRAISRTAGALLVLGILVLALWMAWARLVLVGHDIQKKLDVEIFQKNLGRQVEKATGWIEREMPFLRRFYEPKERGADLSRSGASPEAAKRASAAPLAERIAALLEREIVSLIPDAIRAVATALPALVLIPYMTFFLLRDAKRLRHAAIGWVPNRHFEASLMFLYELDRRMRTYLQALFFDCFLVGLLIGFGSALIDAPYPIAFGLIAFVLNSIPLLGPLLYGAICLFLTLGAGKPPEVVFSFLSLFILSRVCDDLIIIPTIYGRSHHLHPLAVVLAVLLGESLAGAWGMFLAIPTTSILLLGVDVFRELSSGGADTEIPSWAFKPFV
ncbi:MAG: AI-2E family transporter [Verrucomicrobiae bacterium]|nr:AI-2E family transporter [Verrucomicrobiae bacterium]